MNSDREFSGKQDQQVSREGSVLGKRNRAYTQDSADLRQFDSMTPTVDNYRRQRSSSLSITGILGKIEFTSEIPFPCVKPVLQVNPSEKQQQVSSPPPAKDVWGWFVETE
jgi:hypothetical protein